MSCCTSTDLPVCTARSAVTRRSSSLPLTPLPPPFWHSPSTFPQFNSSATLRILIRFTLDDLIPPFSSSSQLATDRPVSFGCAVIVFCSLTRRHCCLMFISPGAFDPLTEKKNNNKLSFLQDVLSVTQRWLDVLGMIPPADFAGIILKAGGVSRWSLLGTLLLKLLKLARRLSSRSAVKAKRWSEQRL